MMSIASPPAGDRAPALSARLPLNVVALGIVSLLTDVSTEMLIPVLPLFITVTLGASVARLGAIEGAAESVSSLLRIVSGRISDRAGRKPFLLAGYGVSGVAKAALAAVASWPVVLGLRCADRAGKALRNPPRDALIADSVPPALRGRAYGLHRGLDTLGAAIGPVAAWFLLGSRPGDFRRIFLWSALPSALAILVLLVFVRAPARQESAMHGEGRAARPAPAFRRFLVADALFQLGNSSMAFVLLRARDSGFDARQVPLVYALYNLAYAAFSYPAGLLADRVGRRRLMLCGYLLYAAAYGTLAGWGTRAAVVLAFAILSVHSALIEVSQRTLVADLAGPAARGAAFGAWHTMVGLAVLPASLVAGWLWERSGAAATFTLGAALALAAAVLFALLLPWREEGGLHAHAA